MISIRALTGSCQSFVSYKGFKNIPLFGNENPAIVVYVVVGWIYERLVDMKKIFLIMAAVLITLPAAASCAISGNSCAYSITKPTLQEKYLPDNVKNIQKPDAFRPRYVEPYHDALINTETGAAAGTESGTITPNNYNSNCQFGVCLPGRNPGAGQVIE